MVFNGCIESSRDNKKRISAAIFSENQVQEIVNVVLSHRGIVSTAESTITFSNCKNCVINCNRYVTIYVTALNKIAS